MDSPNNLRYRCIYCSKDILTTSYFTHQQNNHFDLFWTEQNLKHLSSAYNQAKNKNRVDIITIPDVRGLSKDCYYLNPFNKTLYRQHTKASISFDKLKAEQKPIKGFLEFCENIFNRLNYQPTDTELVGEREHIKKLFQELFTQSDYQNEQIRRYEILINMLKQKADISEDLYEECDCEADTQARNSEKEELLSIQQIDKYSRVIKSIPLTRQKVFEKPTAPSALPVPENAHKITVDNSIAVQQFPTVIETPSIPPLAHKAFIAKKQIVKREPIHVTVELPPEVDTDEVEYNSDSDDGLSPYELLKKNLAKDDRREAAKNISFTQPSVPPPAKQIIQKKTIPKRVCKPLGADVNTYSTPLVIE